MKNAGISQRIKVLTSTLLAAIVVGGAVSFLSVLQLRSSVQELAGTTVEKRIAMDALEDVLEARLAALKHRISPNEATEEAVLENTGEVVKELDALTAMLPEDDPQLQAVDQVRASIADYSKTFERMTDLQDHRNEIFPNLTESGIEARRNLTEVIAGAYSAGNIDAVHRAGIAQEKLLLARFYGERFLLTNEAETLDRARLELEATSAAVADLVAVVREPALRTEARDAAKQVAAYAGFLQEMADTIFARNELNVRLDTVGPATLAQVEGVLDEIGEHQTTIRDAAASMVYWTLVAIGTITGISVMVGIAGLLSSLNFRRTFEAQLEGSLTTMSELANGNLEVEIEGTENETEFGRIARSLTLFRDKGLEARKLAEDAKAQEVAQQKRAAEDAERRRIEEEEAAKHIEAERRKTLAELSASIGQVVRAAVDGDFSQRIEDVFKDPEIQEMAAMINRMAENVENGVNDTAAVMSGLANGDLTLGMSGSHRGKFAELAQSVNEMREKLSQLVERISEQCRDVALAAQSMSGQSNELQGRVEQQAASLEETAAAMEEISATVKSSAENSSIASQHAGATAKKAAEAGHVVENAVAAMGDISEASSKIEDIVAVIDGISFQTSLLALNAGVEAARAGESGRGFAVVASEVRALALRSSEASKDIQALISLSSERIEKGVQLVEATGRTLVEVVGEVEDMSSKLDGLKAATNEQSVGVSEVSGAINQLDGITQENARLADLGNQSSKDVTSQANAMLQLLAFFKTSEDAVAQARLAG